MAKTCEWEKGCCWPVFSKGLCHSHWKMVYGKPLKKFKPLTQTEDGEEAKFFKYQTAEIKKVSTRQQKLNAAYKVLRDAFIKKKKYCVARLDGCTGNATECHHKAGRGEYLLDDTKYLALCHNCHVFITEHSQFAMERGFSESRLSKAI